MRTLTPFATVIALALAGVAVAAPDREGTLDPRGPARDADTAEAAPSRAPSRPASSASRSSTPSSRPATASSRPATASSRPATASPASSSSASRTATAPSRPSTASSRPATASSRPATAPSASRTSAPAARPASTAARPTASPSRPPATRPSAPGPSASRYGHPSVRYSSGVRPSGSRPPAARPSAPPPRSPHYGPRPGYSSRPYSYGPRPVYHYPSSYRYYHVRPYHGVFVYGPRPVHHHHYVHEDRPVEVPNEQMPERKIDRDNSLAVGIRGGSVFSGYDDAKPFADAGIGANVRYRPEESVGLEVAVSTYKQDFSAENDRTITTGQASVELFAWPWTRVSPYAVGGLTVAGREFEDDRLSVATDRVETLSAKDVQWGPHVGLGVEFALGKNVALDLEARYVGFIGQNAEDPRLPGAVQTSAGVMVHF